MRYFQMTPEQRRLLLDNPDNYPLRVSFLGKTGLLTYEEVAFLRRNGVDFDVDDRQAEQLLAESTSPPTEAPEGPRTAPPAAVHASEPREHLSTGWRWVGRALTAAAAVLGILAVAARAVRLLPWRGARRLGP